MSCLLHVWFLQTKRETVSSSQQVPPSIKTSAQPLLVRSHHEVTECVVSSSAPGPPQAGAGQSLSLYSLNLSLYQPPLPSTAACLLQWVLLSMEDNPASSAGGIKAVTKTESSQNQHNNTSHNLSRSAL